MPYLDPDEKKAADRDRYVAKYQASTDFSEKEKARQREIYEKNREKIIARVLARRARLKAAKEAAAAKSTKKPKK